ncbi:MAG: cupredoxin family protein [Burkholderiaceae bacterium]|nr:cupredoxin family protein [Burkholderiaceae bacterium]
MNLTRTLMAFTLLAVSTAVWAHGDKAHTKSTAPPKLEQKDWGIGGNPAAVMRTVTIRMTDNMRFTPDVIQVKQGETVRLVVVNSGKVMHEFVLGTKQELDEHAELMKKFPNMEHDEPYMAHVEPGKQGDIVWHFNRTGEFDFACLLPGHYQAGMVGKIKVLAR